MNDPNAQGLTPSQSYVPVQGGLPSRASIPSQYFVTTRNVMPSQGPVSSPVIPPAPNRSILNYSPASQLETHQTPSSELHQIPQISEEREMVFSKEELQFFGRIGRKYDAFYRELNDRNIAIVNFKLQRLREHVDTVEHEHREEIKGLKERQFQKEAERQETLREALEMDYREKLKLEQEKSAQIDEQLQKVQRDLQDEVMKKEQALSDLDYKRVECDRLQGEVDGMRSNLEREAAEKRALDDLKGKAEHALRSVEAKTEEVEIARKFVEAELLTSKGEKEASEDRIERLEKDVATSESETERIQARLGRLQTEYSDCKKERDSKQDTNQSLQASAKADQRQINALKNENGDLRRRNTELDAQKSAAQTDLANCRQQRSMKERKLEDSIQALEKTVLDLKADSTNAATELAEEKQKYAALQRKVKLVLCVVNRVADRAAGDVIRLRKALRFFARLAACQTRELSEFRQQREARSALFENLLELDQGRSPAQLSKLAPDRNIRLKMDEVQGTDEFMLEGATMCAVGDDPANTPSNLMTNSLLTPQLSCVADDNTEDELNRPEEGISQKVQDQEQDELDDIGPSDRPIFHQTNPDSANQASMSPSQGENASKERRGIQRAELSDGVIQTPAPTTKTQPPSGLTRSTEHNALPSFGKRRSRGGVGRKRKSSQSLDEDNQSRVSRRDYGNKPQAPLAPRFHREPDSYRPMFYRSEFSWW